MGIVSIRPNEYWHIDITHFTTNDGVKHCIYFLPDNFSRKILACRLTFAVNWENVKECVEDAYTIASAMEQPLNLEIVTDGGPENIHHCLNNYISSLIGSIKKSIALKDIIFPNSPAEAENKTFKSYYANHKEIENTKQLKETIIYFVKNFSDERSAKVLKGFTPTEIYSNIKPIFDFVMLRQKDAINRKESPKNNCCKACVIINI